MTNSIKAMLAGAPMAIASDLAHDLMSIELPDAAMSPGPEAAAPVERFTITRGIAVLPVRGILTPSSEILERYLGWSTYFGLTEAVAELSERGDVSAIVLDVNSPGGMVVGCEGAAGAIAAAAQAKPVHAIAAPMAASAAYWLASQANSIAVMPGGIVGSIGVAMMASSVVGPDSHGEQKYFLTSSHARAKRPDPGTEEGMAELRRSLDEAEGQFHAAVSAGRGIAREALPAQLSVTGDERDGGAVFTGQQAIARGLADSVETRAAFYARMIETYGAAGATGPSVRFRARASAAAALARI
ncbi:S49 family peptidase [Paracoccus seriniphilus]|uniref:Peptidase family S49 n=1 Tax=Paracoccus seriniphilus TaxID=184748 RepID=A0A239Q2Q3_9RHOB|nr:S49 family peptidase [Paracoccus seriniphilus]WCR13227.1 S49 family peptidase [Paracoccus seriniphilus]SNT76720.1 Peptidase family S49 [Paracoccus seriniphilus]